MYGPFLVLPQGKMDQCSAHTLKGKQCSKRAVHKGLCTIHLKSAAAVEEPWVELKLVAPSTLNRAHVLAKIRRKLRTAKGGGAGGSIYIYCLMDDKVEDLWKVGMTRRTADIRLLEWQAEHRTSRILKKSEFVVKQSVAYLERLVHLYLDYCRVYRTPLGDGRFRSVFSATGEAIENADEKGGVATRKQVEWFKAPILEIKAVIEALIDWIET